MRKAIFSLEAHLEWVHNQVPTPCSFYYSSQREAKSNIDSKGLIRCWGRHALITHNRRKSWFGNCSICNSLFSIGKRLLFSYSIFWFHYWQRHWKLAVQFWMMQIQIAILVKTQEELNRKEGLYCQLNKLSWEGHSPPEAVEHHQERK